MSKGVFMKKVYFAHPINTYGLSYEQSLEWLKKHQNSDGSWSFDHRDGGPLAEKCQGRCNNPGSMKAAKNAATGPYTSVTSSTCTQIRKINESAGPPPSEPR